MRVLHVITTLEKGGAEKQLVVLSRNQRSLGLSIRVAALKGNLELKDELEDAQLLLIDVLRNVGFLHQILALRRIIKNEKIDLLHLHLPRAEVLGNLATLFMKTSIVSSRHNTEKFFPSAPVFISSSLSRFTTLRFDAVIAISNSVKSFLLTKREVSKRRKLPVILYGYDEKESCVKEPRLLNLGTKLERFVTLSRLVPQKDLKTMIKGLAIYREKYGFGQLEIYGEGHLKEALFDYAKSENVDSFVFFRGRTANVAQVLHQNQVFLLSSKYEGFGLVLLEAMQQGIPIICPNNSAIAEVMGDSYPLFFQTANPENLAQNMAALQEPANYVKFSQLGLERLMSFDPLLCAESTIKVYYGNFDSGRRRQGSRG